MLIVPARARLALTQTYVCPRCAVGLLASHQARRFRNGRGLHLDAQPTDDDVFPSINPVPSRSLGIPLLDNSATKKEEESKAPISGIRPPRIVLHKVTRIWRRTVPKIGRQRVPSTEGRRDPKTVRPIASTVQNLAEKRSLGLSETPLSALSSKRSWNMYRYLGKPLNAIGTGFVKPNRVPNVFKSERRVLLVQLDGSKGLTQDASSENHADKPKETSQRATAQKAIIKKTTSRKASTQTAISQNTTSAKAKPPEAAAQKVSSANSLLQRLENARKLAMHAMQNFKDSLTGEVADKKSGIPESPPSKPKKQTNQKFPVNQSGGLSGHITKLNPIEVEQPPPPRLTYGLDRVLFNPGVYRLQDPRTGVYNFDPYLENIMPVHEFDFNALRKYRTSSQDNTLASIASEHGKKYTGSTSSMTNILSHMHFLLSAWRQPNMSMLSANFPATYKSYTNLSRAPASGVLVWDKKQKLYALDASKEFSTPTVLSLLGRSMEKLLTLNMEDFEQYRKTRDGSPPEEVESYHYTTAGDFIFRSQLDACDPRLPGKGIFDVKTRAVVAVRMDSRNPKQGSGYEILTNQGEWESFEREYYDLIRAAFLKYSLQVRMGRMDGIFVAYHNTERIFGFQYVPLSEMDFALHGQTDPTLGEKEFKFSLGLLNKLLDRAVERFPEQSLQLYFETRGTTEEPWMYFIAKPITELEMEELQRQEEEDAIFVEGEGASVAEELLDTPIVPDSEPSDADSEVDDILSHTDPTPVELDSHIDQAWSHDLYEMAVTSTNPAAEEEPLEHDADADMVGVHANTLESLEGAIDASLREDDDSGATDIEEDGSSTDGQHYAPEDLMVVKVRVQHRRGSERTSKPPNDLTASSPVWNVDYTFSPCTTFESAQRIYEACKTRRKDVLSRSKPWTNAYLTKLRQMSIKGKKRRAQLEGKAAAKVVFVPNS